ncbi:MAG: tRNA(Ile)-lysidine synthetase, partial [Betaproteobacteria bacterium]|nr:tRNA(Ile)-lysidine synthetase [Betaproteobacteria bacterium]
EVGVPPAIAALQRLPDGRQAMVLRLWLRREHGTTPSTAQLRELQAQLTDCTTRGHQLSLRVGSGRVERVGAVLDWHAV